MSCRSLRSVASPSSKRMFARPASCTRRLPAATRLLRDVDAEHVGAGLRRGNRGRAVAAAEVEDLHARRDPERRDQRFAALPHGLRAMPGEVALFPECLVRIHRISCRRSRPRYQRMPAWTNGRHRVGVDPARATSSRLRTGRPSATCPLLRAAGRSMRRGRQYCSFGYQSPPRPSGVRSSTDQSDAMSGASRGSCPDRPSPSSSRSPRTAGPVAVALEHDQRRVLAAVRASGRRDRSHSRRRRSARSSGRASRAPARTRTAARPGAPQDLQRHALLDVGGVAVDGRRASSCTSGRAARAAGRTSRSR